MFILAGEGVAPSSDPAYETGVCNLLITRKNKHYFKTWCPHEESNFGIPITKRA